AGVFFIRTNSGGRTFRLVTAPVSVPQRETWREVIPNRPNVMLANSEAFASHLLLFEREAGLPYLRIVDLSHAGATPNLLDASPHIPSAEPAYNALPGDNPEFAQTHVRFVYESFVTPRSVFDYHVQTHEQTLRKRQPVLGGYDSAQYAIERLHAP